MEEDKYINFFRKKVEPFIALGILIILIILAYQLYEGNNLRIEISQSCGWEDEDFQCFCEKSEALAIKSKIDNAFNFNVGEVENVQVDW